MVKKYYQFRLFFFFFRLNFSMLSIGKYKDSVNIACLNSEFYSYSILSLKVLYFRKSRNFQCNFVVLTAIWLVLNFINGNDEQIPDL